MREILFRGRRKDTGEWVEGYYVRLGEHHYILTGKLDLTMGYPAYIQYDVIPETVGQYTGLTDKNGKKIFEGDIVRYSYDYPDSPFLKAEGKTNEDIIYRTGDVFWSEWRGSWAVSARAGQRGMNQDIYVYVRNPNRVEIIGNIHDNPELMGGKENE